ncbi:hypothetical protein Tco_1546119 [Tanacetum coccineum]
MRRSQNLPLARCFKNAGVQVVLCVSGTQAVRKNIMKGIVTKLKNFCDKFSEQFRFGIVTLEISWVYGDMFCHDNADILKSTDVSVGRSCRYCLVIATKDDIGIFVGYAPNRKGFRIYNKRTRRIMETIHVTFDELLQTMAPVHIGSGPEPMSMTPEQFSSGLIPNQVHATNYVLSTDKDLELLFQPMFDKYFEVTRVDAPVSSATAVNAHVVPPGTSVSTTFAQDAPSTSFSPSSYGIQPPVIQRDVAVRPTIEDTPITQATLYPSNNPVTGEPSSTQSSSGDVSIAEPNQVNQPPAHLRKWSKDHPLDNIVGNPSRPVSTRKQLASDAL